MSECAILDEYLEMPAPFATSGRMGDLVPPARHPDSILIRYSDGAGQRSADVTAGGISRSSLER